MSAAIRIASGNARAAISDTAIVPGARALQRKCACGGETKSGGECEECRKRRERTSRQSFCSSCGEGGTRAGYGLEPSSGVIIKLFADAAAGTTLNIDDPKQQYWFRAGLGAGFEF